MQLYMTGRKKASATANIPAIQILPHPKKYLRYQISQPCRYHRILKSICDSEYPSHADTTTPQKYQATMQSGELKSGMPDEAEQESIVAWYFCGVLWYLRLKQWQTARTVCHLISFILFIKYHFVLLSLLQVCHLQPVIRSHRLFRHFLRGSVLQLMYQRVSADIV